MGEASHINDIKLPKNQEYKHKNKERLCFCCNQLQEKEESIQIFEISNRGYGSIFDGDELEIQLCPVCVKKIKEEWFNESPSYDRDGIEVYRLEDKIRRFISTNITVLENLEYIYNCPNILMIPQKIDRYDWIKDQLDIRAIDSKL